MGRRQQIIFVILLVFAAWNAAGQSNSNSTDNQDDVPASNPDDVDTETLGNLAPAIEQFDPTTVAPCFASDTPEHSFSLSCSAIDIWSNRLLAYSKYPVVQIRQSEDMNINLSSFSNSAFRNSQSINLVNGLVDVTTNDTLSARPQSICDQSTISLLTFLWSDTSSLNSFASALPAGFMLDVDGGPIRKTDCAKHREYGLKLMPMIDRYHRDCFAVCFNTTSNTVSQCGLRQRLGDHYDQALNNLSDPSSSPAINRLRKCPSSGWFRTNSSAAVSKVLKMCASSVSCSMLCSGEIDSATVAARRAVFKAVSDAATGNPASSLSLPSSILQFVKPFSTSWSKIALSADTSGDVFQVALYIDALANPTTGKCKEYDQSMSQLVLATGGALSPVGQYAPSSSSLAIRAVRDPLCSPAALRLEALCATKAVSPLCVRSLSAQVNVSGAFDSCGDSGLSDFFPAVSDYNAKCVSLGLPERPTYGPKRAYLISHPGGRIQMQDCFPDPLAFMWAFLGIGIGMWAVVLALLAVGRERRIHWLASCDVTMDVCRSRSFTVAGTLWLLYSFYLMYTGFLSRVPLKSCSVGLNGTGLCTAYFPTFVFLFHVALLWVAAFGWMMAGNNPYRKHPAALSGMGVLLSNGLTAWLIYSLLDDIDLYGATQPGSTYYWYYQIALFCSLQLAVDAAYLLHFCLWPVLGRVNFQKMRNEVYAAYIHRILDNAPGHDMINKFGDFVRVQLRILVASSVDNPTVSPNAVKQLVAGAAEKHGDCFIIISVTPTDILARDQHQAKKLGIGEQGMAVVLAEVLIARMCLTQQEETVRWSLYEEEINRAMAENRLDDSLRLTAERVNLSKPAPRTNVQDALILSDGLKNSLFRMAIADGTDQVYWASISAGLREYVRLSGNERADRSQTETRERFRARASSLGVSAADVTVLCSLSEVELLASLVQLEHVQLLGSEEAITKLRNNARGILEQGRMRLAQCIEQGDFLTWLRRGADSDRDLKTDERRKGFNKFSLASSCLDAFHFEHFREHIILSAHRTTTSSKKMLEIIQAKIAKEGLSDTGKRLHVLELKRLSTSFVNDDIESPSSASNVNFLPSILFICVGIAALITSLFFANSLSNALNYRALLFEGVNMIQDIQIFVAEFAVALLDLVLCVDPNAVESLRSLTPQQYAQDLKSWPPLVNAIVQVAKDPALNIAGLEATVQQALTDGLSGVGSQVSAALMTTIMTSLGRNTTLSAASVSAIVQQSTKTAVASLISNIATNPVLVSYKDTLPGILEAAVGVQILNLTRPEVIATLPVVGPTLICLGGKLDSPAVADVIQRGINYISSQKIPVSSLITISSVDPCRDSLDVYDCSEHWKNVYPSNLEQRHDLYQLSQMGNESTDILYQVMNQSALVYSSTTVPSFCQIYESQGCVAVLSTAYQARSVAEWGQFVNTTRDLINSYLTPLNDTINYVTYYAETRVMPCFVTGHVTAFVSAMFITCNVLVQFNRRLIEMRQGKNPYHGVFEQTDPATFSSTSTPTLGGMVLATAFAQYYVRVASPSFNLQSRRCAPSRCDRNCVA